MSILLDVEIAQNQKQHELFSIANNEWTTKMNLY